MAPTTSSTSTDLDKTDKVKKGVKCKNKGKVQEAVRMDIVSNLPVEIAQLILMNLSPDDAINAWKCNRRWKNLMNDNYFWEMKCAADKYYELKEENTSKIYKSFIEKFTYWQGVYMYNQRLEHNWKNHNYTTLNVPHVNHYHRIHYFDDSMLIASTTRNLIRVIGSSTGKINSWFACWVDGKFVKVIKRGSFLLAYSTNNCLKVWDIKNQMCVLDMELITKVLASDIYQNLLVLGYDNGKLSIVNVESGLIIYEVDGSPVRCISFHNDFVFTGCVNGYIVGVQISGECQIVHSFLCCRGIPIVKIIIVKGYMMSFSDDGTICIYKLSNTVEKLHTIYAHPSIPLFITYEDQFFCIGQDGISIEVWNFVTGNRILRINNQVPITFLRTNASQVITCSTDDNSTKMWCLNTGRFISHIKLKVQLSNIKSIFFTKTKLVYFGWTCVKKSYHSVMCIRNYEF